MLKAFTSNANRTENSYDVRIFLLLSVIVLALVFLGARMFNLQVLSHDYYKALASNQHGSIKSIKPNRGEIYFSSVTGDPILVATNVNKNMVFAVPKDIEDKQALSKVLAPLLEMEVKDIEARLAGSGSFSVLKRQIEDDVVQKLRTLKLKGIYLQAEDIRFYPEKELASQIIGFLGFKGDARVGQYGVEGRYESSLAGSTGFLDADTDPLGRWITTASRSFKPAADGDDIYLTIDRAIQFKAEEVLERSVAEHGAEQGSIVVLNPKTGAILAMANAPRFDLNNYGKVPDISVYNNKILTEDYEPGSVFKPLTMAAAINEKLLTPQSKYVDEGMVKVDDREIKNSDPEPQGEQNMIQVMSKSLNTGMVYVQQQMGNALFKNYVERFGFGRTVEFDLAGQAKGNIDNLDRRGNVFFSTASFGHGITVTPLQLIQSFTALANGGKMMTPYVVDKIVHPDGSENKPRPGNTSAQVLDLQTAAQISAMLADVVENGHGRRAAVPGYYIAGKTGTAQVAYKDRQGYDPTKYIGSFIGYGPVEDPQFLALVRIDNPKDVKFAESTAAPVFGELAAFILNYMQIPPSR